MNAGQCIRSIKIGNGAGEWAMFDRETMWRVCLILGVALAQARAESPSITAVLSDSEAAVGQTVQMDIRVSVANNAEAPADIVVDGLEIHRTGTSRQFEMRNFSSSSSVVYSYTVLPMKAGTFTIPPQTVRAGGTQVKTPALTLRVVDSPGNNRANVPAGSSAKLAWAEVIIPKKEAYLGESIPAEIRIGIDERVRFDGQAIMQGPDLKLPGITFRKWEKPTTFSQIKNGRREGVYVYKTAISPAKIGHFDIPAELKIAMQWPVSPSQRGHSPRDIFGMEDFFDEMGPNPFAQYTQPQEVTIRSEPATLEVKPLPPGAPSTFSGAVGNFSMTTDANPKRLQVGDPITIKVEISGRGNFDRVNAPAMSDENGWHSYPPSANFKQDDDAGLSGTKNFEMVVSPNETKQSLPPLAFTYFDPLKEKYVTLQSEVVPLTVLGNAAPSPSVAVAAVTPAPVASPKTTSPTQEILQQIPDRGKTVSTFAPLFARKEFWLAQLVPLAFVLGLGLWKISGARAANRAALRAAALRHEADELLRSLRRKDLPSQQYFFDASRVVQLKTALKANVEPGTVDAESASRAFALDENEREQLRRLFATKDEFRYSGAANGAVSPERREEALALIEGLS
jgi:hypothetical protein